MSRRRISDHVPTKAELTPEAMRGAIPRLKKRLAELNAVDPATIEERYDPALTALEQRVLSTLEELFPPGTIEHGNFCHVRLDTAGLNINHPTPLHLVRQGYAHGLRRAIATIENVISLFDEKLDEFPEDTKEKARRVFAGLNLHPELARSPVPKLFSDGHFANAVEDACKVLDGMVKYRSGRHDLSGTELMQAVFSTKNPVLKFNNLETESDRSEQQGMMFLYSGVMLALRNPRAHQILTDEAETALEYIALLNLLLRTLERAKQ